MKQHPVFITESAKREIRGIVSYLRGRLGSEQTADAFVEELCRQESLSRVPGAVARTKKDPALGRGLS